MCWEQGGMISSGDASMPLAKRKKVGQGQLSIEKHSPVK